MKARDFINGGQFSRPPKMCGCGCGKPLEPRVDGLRHMINDKEVNADCWYGRIGEAMEESPVGGGGIRRG